MRIRLRSLALLGVPGLLTAGAGWLVWYMVFDAELYTLWPALAIGVTAAVSAGALAIHRHADPRVAADEPKPKPPKRKRRRRWTSDGLAYVSAALRWQALSASLLRLLRVAKPRLVGKPIYSILHPEDISAVDRAFTQAAATGKVELAYCRFLIADQQSKSSALDGSARSDTKVLPPLEARSCAYFRIDVRARMARTGKVRRFVCRFIDLTAFVLDKETEAESTRRELARTRRFWQEVSADLTRLKISYRDLYQNAPVMYFSLDTHGTFVGVNDTLIQTLGYERAELQGNSYAALVTPSALRIAGSTPVTVGERETQWRRKDGSVIDIWLHTVPVYDEARNVVRFRSAALDLTEKNRLANELRARGDELERTNQRLRTINGELEAYTHVVSHDLKEPLRTLQAYSHMLAEEHGARLGADGFQYVNHLIRASRRLGLLIDELLNHSQAGRLTRAPRVFSLLEIVATVRQDLVDLIQRKQAVLSTQGSLPDVIGDTVRITQLLTNLVGNGLKYNTNPLPRVVISAAVCHDDPARVTVAVRDNGIGIDPAFHQQIFGIFRRLHQADEFEGTGAGLAICKKIVEGHGGRIWVESAPGAGAAFYFTLPRYLPASDAQPPVHAAPPPVTPAKTLNGAVRPSRIVLVEDQHEVALIIQKLGTRDGLTITWFPTAEGAWDYLQQGAADLLLLDVNLPGMNGVELCKRVRGLDHLKTVPVAMFTPEQDSEEVEQYRQAGADFFLTKDLLCRPRDWQQRIRALLEQIR